MGSDCWLMTYNVSKARNCNAATEIMLFFITNGGILNEQKPAFVHNYNLKNTCAMTIMMFFISNRKC